MNDATWYIQDASGKIEGPLAKEMIEARIFAGIVSPETWLSADNKDFLTAKEWIEHGVFKKEAPKYIAAPIVTKQPVIILSPLVKYGGGFICACILFCIIGAIFFPERLKKDTRNTISQEQRDMESRIGKMPEKSTWDGSVACVKDYLNITLHDPNSVEYISWSDVKYADLKPGEFYWVVYVKFRAKNAFGALVINERVFNIRNGKVEFCIDRMGK